MKKIKFFILLGLFCMISLGASAEEIPNDEIWYTSSDGDIVTTYSAYDDAFDASFVSNTYRNGKGIIKLNGNVTSICNDAFFNRPRLTSVTIPNSVTSIGDGAFHGCSGLTSVTIPNSVTSIGKSAFSGCSGLISVTIGNSVTSIGDYAFGYCSGLISVTIGNSVISIGKSAFSGCSGLASVTIPESVTSIGIAAFYGCSGLTIVNITDLNKWAEIEFGNGDANPLYFAHNLYLNEQLVTEAKLTNAKKIGSYAFYACSSLTSFEIPNSVISIDTHAFSECSGLTSVTIPNSVTSIGDGAFNECSNLTSIEIPTSVASIGSYTFWKCSSLASVTIPNSITSIGSEAFYKCLALASVTIPNSVTSIGSYAFDGCSGLTSVYVEWKDANKIPYIGSSYFPYSTCSLYVPSGTKSIYQGKEYWKKFKSIVDGVKITINNMDDSDGSIIADNNTSFTLYDNIKSISVPKELEDVTITYTRNFEKAGVWQGWYMPFDVDFDDMKDAYDVAQIHGVLLDKDNNAVLAFLKLDDGTVKANTPYVVRPKASGEVSIETTTDLQPTQSKSFLMMSATDKYTIGGVYEKTTTPGSWYALNLDGQFQLMGSGVYLRPFRIYMTIDPRTDNPYAQSASTTAKMDIVVIGDDETTGITSYENPSTGSGQAQNDNIYNLNGQRVTSIKSGQIYIMNGKKYIAK